MLIFGGGEVKLSNYVWRLVGMLELLDQSGLVNHHFLFKSRTSVCLCLQHSSGRTDEYEISTERHREGEWSEPDNVEIFRPFEKLWLLLWMKWKATGRV